VGLAEVVAWLGAIATPPFSVRVRGDAQGALAAFGIMVPTPRSSC